MNDEEQANLEKEMVLEFKNRGEKIQNEIVNEINISNENTECFESRSAGKDYDYFHKGLKPNKAKDGFNMSFCIIIRDLLILVNSWIYFVKKLMKNMVLMIAILKLIKKT